MKATAFFNVFAAALSLVLLALATLHPAQEPGADYAAIPTPVRPVVRAASLPQAAAYPAAHSPSRANATIAPRP